MYLVTHRKTNVQIDPETREPVPHVTTEANLETSEEAAWQILALRNAGDDRVRHARVFEILVDAEGEPTIGAELD